MAETRVSSGRSCGPYRLARYRDHNPGPHTATCTHEDSISGEALVLGLGLGVREVWLVDRLRQAVEVADLDGSRMTTDGETARSRVIPGFELDPAVLFAVP